MGDILKEAIADAKAVRETALENAKMALEEAFTPQIKSMLSAKLKEDEIEESDPVVEDEDMDMDDEEEVADEVPAEDMDMGDEEGDDEEAEEGYSEEGYHEDDEMEDEEEVEEGNLDLEAIIKELEDELSEGEEDEDGEEVEESTEAVSEDTVEESDEPVEESTEEVDEEIEIDENALTEDDEDNSELSEVQAELKEYKEAVTFLKDKLHEVNILNAKLLFTNKLFKQYSLNNNQKLKVVETFDRAQTTREIKLVYSTLAEQFNYDGSTVIKKSISESASAAVGSTKPSDESRKVISEETQVADRFRKLAGLIK